MSPSHRSPNSRSSWESPYGWESSTRIREWNLAFSSRSPRSGRAQFISVWVHSVASYSERHQPGTSGPLAKTILRHHDPFYLKEEFAPSDKASLSKRQQAANSLIAPHLRILQFFTSHFNATRLGSPHTQRIFHRLIVLSLKALRGSAGHPLAREVYFHLVLFGLNLLSCSNYLDPVAQWRLKDTILSAGLRWFSHQPR